MKNLLIVLSTIFVLLLIGCVSEQVGGPGEITPEASTIAEVVQQLKENPEDTFQVTIIGVVTYEYDKYLFVQDETGAMKVYYGSGGIDEVVDIGDKVRVSGEAQYYSYGHDYEVVPEGLDDVEIVEEDYGEPEARELTTTPTEDDYGYLVTFSGTCTQIDTQHKNVTFSLASTEVTVKNYVEYPFEVGKYYTVKGVVMWNYDRYKVTPRSSDDIVEH